MNAQVNQPTAETFALWREIAELGIDTRAVMQEMIDGNDDFEVDGYRFINTGSIDQILCDELETDSYLLGCFASWAIADATGWPQDIIEVAQASEGYEKLGEAMTKKHISALADTLVSNDGYGHHFSHYDGSEQEIGDYYVFRVN